MVMRVVLLMKKIMMMTVISVNIRMKTMMTVIFTIINVIIIIS